MIAVSRRLVKSRPSQVLSGRVRCSARITATGCSGQLGRSHAVLDVLAAELAGEDWVAVGLAVGGQQPGGVGAGLDGAWALVLGFQGAAEAAVGG
jgi:hypothetical protein